MAFRDLGQILIDSTVWVEALKELIPEIAKLTGYIFGMQGFIKLYKLGDQRRENVTIGSVITTFLISGALIQYGNTESIATSILGLTGGTSYAPATGSTYMDNVIKAVLSIVELFGIWAIFSSLLDAKKAGDGEHNSGNDFVSMAFWKFFGGAVAINIKSFLN